MIIRTQVVVLFFLLISINLFSQVSDSLFDLSCQNEDLVILSEDMEVHITGRKTFLMIATVRNNLTVIIKTPKGLTDFQPVTLPEKFDELYIYHAPTVRNIDWDYDNISVQYFNAGIKDGLANQIDIKVTQHVKTKRVIDMAGFFGYINQYEFFLEDLQVGDTLQLSYEYEIPFIDNWIKLLSNRIFFHGNYPKKSYSLTWCHNKELEVDSLFVNHDTPEISLDGNKLCYHWNFNNLSGCLDEEGSQPYRTLPHFVFVPQSYDLEYTHFNSYIQEFVPAYYLEASKRQDELEIENWDNVIGNKNKNNIHYQKVADKIIALAPDDTLGVGRLRYFQQFLVNSVNYDPAINYYDHNEDHKIQRAGVDLWANILKDNNLELIYGNMIPRLGMDMFIAYPIDKRMGIISPQYHPTVKDNDLMLAIILNDNSLGFVIPKSDKNNYYFEELPFYYEEIPVLLLHYKDYPGRLEKRNYNTDFRQYTTPSSNWKDNYRKIQSKVSINIENNTAEFQTRVILSGQYSTLTRCVYCDNPVDSTINLKYLEPIWNIADNVDVKNVKSQDPLIYYPFKTTIMAGYTANDLLSVEDNRYTLKPGSWFKLIYSQGISSETRFLDYYPDFVGSDSYSYMLEFDKPIKLISSQDTIDITNYYGHLSFLAKQIGENKILLSCNYNILANKITNDSIGFVKDINQAISVLDQKEIVIELVE